MTSNMTRNGVRIPSVVVEPRQMAVKSARQQPFRATRRENGTDSDVGDADLDLADAQQHALTQLDRGGLGARTGDDRLDRALEVVALQAGVACVEVCPDDRAVGGVELVVDEVDDLVEEVGSLAGRRLVAVLVRAHESPPSCPAFTGSRRRSLTRT